MIQDIQLAQCFVTEPDKFVLGKGPISSGVSLPFKEAPRSRAMVIIRSGMAALNSSTQDIAQKQASPWGICRPAPLQTNTTSSNITHSTLFSF